MKHIDLKGKKIRLFFHTDIDGTIAASLIQLFSGATIVQLMPCGFQNFPKPEKSNNNILDVFVDCRSRNRDEDIRIDHHASGEETSYLQKEGIIVDTEFKSAVSLVAKYLSIPVNAQILQEMDFVDSGQPNVFSKFVFDNSSISKILFNPRLLPEIYMDYEKFKDALLSVMVKGWAVETEVDTPGNYERKLEEKFKIIIKDIKIEGGPLIKIIHSPVKEGFFSEQVFKMTDSDFYGQVLPYVQQHLYEESKRQHIGVYVIVGFFSRNHEFDAQLMKITKETHPEPYQIFVSRSPNSTNINLGELIQAAKTQTGITNGGGRADVGGVNTNEKNKAITALKFIISSVEEQCKKHSMEPALY